MKIRNDFVTNSSSSSFIISFNDKCPLDNSKECPISKTNKLLLKMFASYKNDFFYDGDGFQIETIEQLKEYFRNQYCYNDDAEIPNDLSKDRQELYEKMLLELEKENFIVVKDIHNDDDEVMDILNSILINPQFTIIHKTEN